MNRNALLRGDRDKDECAAHVEQEGQREAGENQTSAPEDGEAVKFTEEQRDHQARLKRADATARLVDPHHASADFDHVAVLNGGNSKPTQRLDRRRRVGTRQSLDQRPLNDRRPGHGDEEETNGEDKS